MLKVSLYLSRIIREMCHFAFISNLKAFLNYKSKKACIYISIFQDIKIIQKRKAKEMEDLVEIKIAKEKFERQLVKIKKEISILEFSIGVKKRKLEEEEREKEQELDKQLVEMARKNAATKDSVRKEKDERLTNLDDSKSEEVKVMATHCKMPKMVPARRMAEQEVEKVPQMKQREQMEVEQKDVEQVEAEQVEVEPIDLQTSKEERKLHVEEIVEEEVGRRQKLEEIVREKAEEVVRRERLEGMVVRREKVEERKVASVPPSTAYQSQSLGANIRVSFQTPDQGVANQLYYSNYSRV